jgi:hypothetical protein
MAFIQLGLSLAYVGMERCEYGASFRAAPFLAAGTAGGCRGRPRFQSDVAPVPGTMPIAVAMMLAAGLCDGLLALRHSLAAEPRGPKS